MLVLVNQSSHYSGLVPPLNICSQNSLGRSFQFAYLISIYTHFRLYFTNINQVIIHLFYMLLFRDLCGYFCSFVTQ